MARCLLLSRLLCWISSYNWSREVAEQPVSYSLMADSRSAMVQLLINVKSSSTSANIGRGPPTTDGEVEQQILGGLVKVVSKSIDLGKNLYVDLDFTLLLLSLTTAASILLDQQLPLALHPCPPFGEFPLILFLLFGQHPVELQKFLASERSIVDKHFFPTEDGGFGNDSVGLMCQFYPALGVMAVVEHFQFWHKSPHSRAIVVIVGVVGISGLNHCHKVHDLIQGY